MYAIEYSDQNRLYDIHKFYDLYHELYLKIWANYHNLAFHMGYYDETITSHEESLLKMNHVVFATAKIKQNDLVLDAGCGVGGSAIWLAKSKGCKVTGISLVDNEIKLAKKLSKQKKIDNLTDFKIMDMTHTNFDNQTFSVVMAVESLCYIMNKSNFLIESFRILKRGGRLIVADYFSKDNPSISEQTSVDQINKMSMINLCTQNEFQNILESNGFTNIKLHDISHNVKVSYKNGIDKLSKLLKKTNNSPVLKKAIEEEKSRSILEYNCLNDKILKYGLIYAEKSRC